MIGVIQFQHPTALLLLPLLVGLWLLFRWASKARRRSLEAIGGAGGGAVARGARRHRFWRESWLLVTLLCLVLALARPWWKKIPADASAGGRDVLFLLDVSRSMLAEDLSPNRLDSAKLAIHDCLQRLEGNRVALVTFAGSSSIECPFTTDYNFFRNRLGDASPANVSQGGTRIGDALRKSIDKVIEEDRKGLQDIILLSDGGDQDSQPLEAAAALADLKVHLIVVGLGDSVTGARIPARARGELERGLTAPTTFTMHQGREVWSKLERDDLDRVAKACPLGVFLPAGTRPLDLGSVYLDLAKHFDSGPLVGNDSLRRPKDEFHRFLLAGLAALLLAQTRLPFSGSGDASPKPRQPSQPISASLSLILVLALFSLAAAPSPDPNDEEQMTDVPLLDAIPEDPVAAYQMGCERYEDTNFASAADCFRASIERLGTDPLRGPAAGNLGLCLYRQAEQVRMADPMLASELFLRSAAAFRSRLDWEPDHEPTAVHLELSRKRCRECEEDVRRAQEQQADEQEQDEGDESEEGDSESEGEEMDEESETEEGESEGEADSTNQSSSQNAMDLDSRDLPPPSLDPEDIFREQAENELAREKKGPGKYRAVERDW